MLFRSGAEAGRAIVLQWNAVHNDLGLILGAAGVEHGVAFVQPSGLGVHEVLQGAAGDGALAIFDLFAADAVDAAGAIGIDERVGLVDLDGAAGGGDAELGGEIGGGSGADVDGFSIGRKTVAADFDGVEAIGKALDGEGAGFIGGVGGVDLVHGAGEGYIGADGRAGWIADLDAEVAGVALSFGQACCKNKKQKEICNICKAESTDQVGHPHSD